MILKEAVVFLTGANRGIGRAILNELIKKETKRIYAAARKPETFTDLPANVISIRLDITSYLEIERVAKEASDTTLLINNAGILASGKVLDTPLDLLKKDMETNYYGTLNMIKVFSSVIEQNGGGAIANVLSVVSLASAPFIGGYCASKAAAYSLTQSVRTELKSKNIKVYGIFPGAVDTEMTVKYEMPKTRPEIVAEQIILGIENGEQDIFPDPMSFELSVLWQQNPKALEDVFAAM